MENTKVYIVDSNIKYSTQLADFLNSQEDMEVIGIANDEVSCFSSPTLIHADVLIIDVLMPIADGITILEALKSRSSFPAILLILTIFYSDYVKRKAEQIGATVFPKSIHKERFIQEMRQIIDKKKASHLDSISTLLYSLGIPNHFLGFQYLYEAIRMLKDNRELLGAYSTVILPEIARKFQITPKSINKRIQYAIKIAWNQGKGPFSMRKTFHTMPSNTEFIAYCAWGNHQGWKHGDVSRASFREAAPRASSKTFE
jgi:two-component system, response regulator, stage 0 sporulation protein A